MKRVRTCWIVSAWMAGVWNGVPYGPWAAPWFADDLEEIV